MNFLKISKFHTKFNIRSQDLFACSARPVLNFNHIKGLNYFYFLHSHRIHRILIIKTS
jgi:hypothetical protein